MGKRKQSEQGTKNSKKPKLDSSDSKQPAEEEVNEELLSKTTFAACADVLSRETLDAVKDMRFTHLTRIQDLTLHPTLEGTDVLGRAKTGSGKTLAFLVPIIEQIKKTSIAPMRAIILCPSRELALQIEMDAKKLLVHHRKQQRALLNKKQQKQQKQQQQQQQQQQQENDVYDQYQFSCRAIYGGTSMNSEQALLNSTPPTILVATPGRLKHHLQTLGNFREQVKANLKHFVIDEADTLLEAGWKDALTTILEHLPSERQTCLFSATLTQQVSETVDLLLKEDHLFVSTITDDSSPTNSQCVQEYIKTPSNEIFQNLFRLLKQHQNEKIMVFFQTCIIVTYASELFRRLGFPIFELTGDWSQAKRREVFLDFLNKKVSKQPAESTSTSNKTATGAMLFCTDVASRGLHIPNVDMIVQVGIPEDPQSYIHRIGRTARVGHRGRAVLLLRPFEEHFLDSLAEVGIVDVSEHTLPPPVQKDQQFMLETQQNLNNLSHALAKHAYRTYLGALSFNSVNWKIPKESIFEEGQRFSESCALRRAPSLTIECLQRIKLLKYVPHNEEKKKLAQKKKLKQKKNKNRRKKAAKAAASSSTAATTADTDN